MAIATELAEAIQRELARSGTPTVSKAPSWSGRFRMESELYKLIGRCMP